MVLIMRQINFTIRSQKLSNFSRLCDYNKRYSESKAQHEDMADNYRSIMSTAIISIIGLVLVALNSIAQKPHYIKANTYEGVIFTKSGSSTVKKGVSNIYIPTDSEIATMEIKIANSIDKLLKDYKKDIGYLESDCDIAKNIRKYKRNYFGFYFGEGKVIITSFHLYVKKNWKETMQVVQGGKCENFTIKYIIDTGTLTYLTMGKE